ncbi:hypothetical protein K432DRAFT_108150 [Lepidopterella palustris CBS 459.81]|uniref:Uncharacterized protein n=1 Tax=Lepidopterella palustris CBS 459.81 TaxID=1314670 RepID=A0A8E2E642_9PEZI|nr:hypothetical protein K432DRAFT_108150 [Lepidopterella palustris CBS 459.81]
MPPSASRRPADGAPFQRRKIRRPSRTGLDERGRTWKWREDNDVYDTAEHRSCESDRGWEKEPVVELMAEIYRVLDKLDWREGLQENGNRTGHGVAVEPEISIQYLATQPHDLLTPSRNRSPDIWISSFSSETTPPPSYDDSCADLPPDYASTDALASVQIPDYSLFPSLNPSLVSSVPACLRWSGATSPNSSILDEKFGYPDVDFSNCDPENIRTYAKKKAKQAAKQTQQSKWSGGNGDDGEKKEEGATGGDENGDAGGGDGGAGGNGGGGDGDGGGGGDDWGGWDDGKKKKKGKKGKAQEEEEERKRKEEEERKLQRLQKR